MTTDDTKKLRNELDAIVRAVQSVDLVTPGENALADCVLALTDIVDELLCDAEEDKPLRKRYSDVAEMVKDLSGPEFSEEYERFVALRDAAPELIAALKEILLSPAELSDDRIGYDVRQVDKITWAAAKAAIAKAEGAAQ